MKLVKQDGVYVAHFKGQDGKMHQRTTKMGNIDDAKKIVEMAKLKELEMAAMANALTADSLQAIMAGRRCTMEMAIEEWAQWREQNAEPNTIHTQRTMLNQWVRSLGAEAWPVTKITADHINGFVNEADENVGKSTRTLRLSAIRSLFKLCNARCYCMTNPSQEAGVQMRLLSHEQKEPVKRKPISEAQYRHIMANTEGFWRWATALSYWTGLRMSDIANLEWSCFTGDSIIVHMQKTDVRVAIPLAEPLIGGGELGRIMLEMSDDAAAGKFCFPKQRKLVNDPARRHHLSMQYGRLLSSCGIEHRSFHCLRHSFVTRLNHAGKSLEEIGRVVGHSSAKVTEGYAH
jgi:integrase